jgi:excisionase family DNA binding protein
MSSVQASVLQEPLLTVKDVAALLRVSSSWVYDRASKDLPSVYVGGLLRFERSSIEEWLHRLPVHGLNTTRPRRSAR